MSHHSNDFALFSCLTPANEGSPEGRREEQKTLTLPTDADESKTGRDESR